jgi:hypothetical protein
MAGEEHYRRAEELAAKAAEYLGQGDGQDSAAVWAAVTQVHATLALAVAMDGGSASRGRLRAPAPRSAQPASLDRSQPPERGKLRAPKSDRPSSTPWRINVPKRSPKSKDRPPPSSAPEPPGRGG